MSDMTSTTTPRAAKRKLKKAFGILRRMELLAVERAACCGSCSTAKLSVVSEEKIGRGERVRGVVYTTLQDSFTLRARGLSCWISYSSTYSTVPGHVDELSTIQVGQIVCEALVTVGFGVKWSGDSRERILAFAEPAEQPSTSVPPREGHPESSLTEFEAILAEFESASTDSATP